MFRMNFSMVMICVLLKRQYAGFYFALLISVCYTVTATVLTAWLFTCMLVNYLVRRNTPASAAADPEAQTGKLPTTAPFFVRYFCFIKDGVFGVFTIMAFIFLWRTTKDKKFFHWVFFNK